MCWLRSPLSTNSEAHLKECQENTYTLTAPKFHLNYIKFALLLSSRGQNAVSYYHCIVHGSMFMLKASQNFFKDFYSHV